MSLWGTLFALACFVGSASASPVTSFSSFAANTTLGGPFVVTGFVRFLAWPLPPGSSPSVCATQDVGSPGTVVIAFRINRCISAFSASATVPINTFVNTPKNYTVWQTNGTHVDAGTCDDVNCLQGCIHWTYPINACTLRPVTIGSVPASFTQTVLFLPEVFVLPSPTMCTRVKANGDCSGETLVQTCITTCLPVLVQGLGLPRFTCSPDVNSSIVGSLCPVPTAGSLPQALMLCQASGSQPCPDTLPPSILPPLPGTCVVLPNSGYGFSTLGCTIGADPASLHAFDCAGMTEISGATCNGPGNSTLEGNFPKQVDGSWVPGNVQFAIHNLLPNVTLVAMHGNLAPNGQLSLQFDTQADVNQVLNVPVAVFNYTGLSVNRDGATRFAAVTATVTTSGQALCVSPDYQATALVVTVSLSCGLARSEIIGIAVGASVFGVAAAVTIVLLTRYAILKRTAQLQAQGQQDYLEDLQRTPYVRMGSK